VRLALWIGQLSLDTRSGEIVAQRARVLSVSDFRRTVWTVEGEPERAPLDVGLLTGCYPDAKRFVNY
jgi:hypothetical protein